jgi:hypothetical protein
MGATSGEFIAALAAEHRVILIGGLAVIAHGYNRPTKDADIWLEPFDSPQAWAQALNQICAKFQGLTLHSLPGWEIISGSEIAEAADEVGMIRVLGMDCPVDIFRKPNEFPTDSFDEVFTRATSIADGTKLPDPLDLIITKLNTGRDKDLHDSQHLESVIRERYRNILPTASLDEVKHLLERFVDWEVCKIALDNPNQNIRDYVIDCLREMAAEGDPFSQALLEEREIPYS